VRSVALVTCGNDHFHILGRHASGSPVRVARRSRDSRRTRRPTSSPHSRVVALEQCVGITLSVGVDVRGRIPADDQSSGDCGSAGT
jgi:hypothetical protein